jgi:hypothetical protein
MRFDIGRRRWWRRILPIAGRGVALGFKEGGIRLGFCRHLVAAARRDEREQRE